MSDESRQIPESGTSRPIDLITVINLLSQRHGFVPPELERKIELLTPDLRYELSIDLFEFRQLSDLELWLVRFD